MGAGGRTVGAALRPEAESTGAALGRPDRRRIAGRARVGGAVPGGRRGTIRATHPRAERDSSASSPAAAGSLGVGSALEHLLGGGDLVGLAGELHVEPVVGDDREQRVEQGAGEVAPGGDVGELPPPQRLGGVAEAEVAQPVLEVGWRCWSGRRRAGSRPARGRRGRRRSCRCRCRRSSSARRSRRLVEVGVGADVGLVVVRRA